MKLLAERDQHNLPASLREAVAARLTDHLGSTVALADSTGAVVSSTSYDSFGNATSSIATTYRYTGREYDPETGLYYYRNRWYDPEIGRFISEDPIGFAGGDINLYGYVGSNPLRFIDPFGNYACKRQKGGYPGGKRNPIAQLAPCLKLNVPGFGALPKVARTLLDNTFGKLGAFIIYKWFFSTYQKAVFVNTVVAAAYVKADFSNAKFKDFYRADFNYENGIYVDGLGSKGTTRGRHEIGGGGGFFWSLGFGEPGASVEFEKGHIDVDLYHNRSLKGLVEHGKEVNFNKRHKRGTHPGDVVKRLKDTKGINTGVSCKRR